MFSISGSQPYWNHLGSYIKKKNPNAWVLPLGSLDLTGLGSSMGFRIFKSSLSDSNLQLRLGIKGMCEGKSSWMIKGDTSGVHALG